MKRAPEPSGVNIGLNIDKYAHRRAATGSAAADCGKPSSLRWAVGHAQPDSSSVLQDKLSAHDFADMHFIKTDEGVFRVQKVQESVASPGIEAYNPFQKAQQKYPSRLPRPRQHQYGPNNYMVSRASLLNTLECQSKNIPSTFAVSPLVQQEDWELPQQWGGAILPPRNPMDEDNAGHHDSQYTIDFHSISDTWKSIGSGIFLPNDNATRAPVDPIVEAPTRTNVECTPKLIKDTRSDVGGETPVPRSYYNPDSLWNLDDPNRSNGSHTSETLMSGAISSDNRRNSSNGLIPLSNSSSATNSGNSLPPPWSTLTAEVAGERVLLERLVCYSRDLNGFHELDRHRALLKIFRSPQTKCLRFQLTTVDGIREYSFELQPHSAELVPAYAYEMHWENVLYIQMKSQNDETERLAPLQRKIRFLCRLDSTADVAELQRALLGEAVVLDISSIRSICFKQKKHTVINSNCRMQVWHEDRSSHYMQSDTTSFITNTTKVSGRPMENTRPRYTRLMVFLGREEEYLTLLITDDVQLVRNEGSQRHIYSVHIRPRKASGRRLRGRARPSSLRIMRARRNSHAAGFSIDEPSINPEDDSLFEECESISIEFESGQEYQSFIEIWDQAIDFRRQTREVLHSIDVKMEREQFSGKIAGERIFWGHF